MRTPGVPLTVDEFRREALDKLEVFHSASNNTIPAQRAMQPVVDELRRRMASEMVGSLSDESARPDASVAGSHARGDGSVTATESRADSSTPPAGEING